MDIHQARAALSVIPSDDRELWVRMAIAMRSEFGDDGFSAWEDWSQTAPNYNPRAARDVWKSAKPGGRITIGTLIHYARQYGWKSSEPLTRPDPAAIARRNAEFERLREHEYAEAAIAACNLWLSAVPALSHPYTDRKGIKPIGARVTQCWPGRSGDLALILRVMDGPHHLSSLQAIFADGSRRFYPGARAQGCYLPVRSGQPPESPVVICEGYATAVSIHECTGLITVAAFSAGNLYPVAQKILRLHPSVNLIIAADDDRWTNGNTGMTAATQTAEATKSRLVVPPPMEDGMTDFNDLHQSVGADAVRACFDVPRITKPSNDH